MVKYLKIEMTILQFQIQENSAFCSFKYKKSHFLQFEM